MHRAKSPGHRDDENAAQAVSNEGGGRFSAQSLAAVLVLGLLAVAAFVGAGAASRHARAETAGAGPRSS